MALIVLSDAQLAFGHVALLDHAELSLQPLERLGLIGRNGTGKSSLLKILAGQVSLDDGLLQQQQGLRTAFVQQEPMLDKEATIFDEVAKGVGSAKRLREEYEALGAQAVLNEQEEERLHQLGSEIEALHGWAWEQHVHQVLDRLGLNPAATIGTLSGGNQKRVAIAQALVAQPDVLLLDEPTNHLDINAIVWLEELIKEFSGAVIFVTHDRAFLNSVCTAIIELDRGKLARFPGNFSEYQRLKEQALSAESLANARQDKLLAQEEVWIRQGVEARRTRSVSRIQRLEKLRASRAERRTLQGNVRLSIAAGDRSGKIVAELEDVSKAFDRPVIRHFSATILRGDKVGVIGPNGAGKTTLLKVLLGELKPDSGTIRLGTRLEVAYFDQLRTQLDLESSLEDFISPGSEWVEINGVRKHVKSYLGDFLFAPQRAGSPVKSLSGGERNRLLLARLFARPANVLVLDEPTNDLDVETLELLEELLQNYTGTVFLVSHDRYFLDQVATSVIAYEGGGHWQQYVGGYDDWLRQRPTDRPAPQTVSPKKTVGSLSKQANTAEHGLLSTSQQSRQKKSSAPRLNSKEKQELAGLPDQITALEKEQAEISASLADPQTYKNRGDHVAALQARFAEIEALNEQLLRRWEELLKREESAL